MASSFKTLTPNDRTSTKTLLHEAIPITGSMVSGTYAEANIKTYSHGMFESVYDYPYLSSSANHIFDITCGFASSSALSSSDTDHQNMQKKKINIYNQMAQVLAGFGSNGDVQRFDQDGNIALGGTVNDASIFLNFARILSKDEIQKGSFSLKVYASGSFGYNVTTLTTLTDAGAENDYKVNSPAGEYGIVKDASTSRQVGLIYYQAGIVVLTASLFDVTAAFDVNDRTYPSALSGSTIDEFALGFRRRWYNCSFNNTTELNSTIYFCRAMNSDFNYSGNPTYLSASKVFVKEQADDLPMTFFTTVGLYSPDNELLAVAKLSEPLKKTPANELTLRVRLDY
jgi:hypothetical protein